MKLEKFKEVNRKKIGIILFTITCILLISGVILYRTFAIFQVNETQNMIEGTVQDMGDVEFAFYIDGSLSKTVPDKKEDYSLDTSASKCIDMTTGNQTSNVNWDNENWEVRLKNISTTKTKCYLYFKKIYKEEILNGAIPDLGNGRLIPVTISDNEKPSDVTEYSNTENKYGGKVYKADITSDWYKYEDHIWANAIILKDGVADNYTPGDEIKEKDIESYFVWIPRYKYEIFNEGIYNSLDANVVNGRIESKSQIINIQFENKNNGISTGSTKGSWLTHPAFTSFNNNNGFWVGKFETGATIDSNYNIRKADAIQIKPNVKSWITINIANAFYNSYDYLRELDSHLIKNTEWGCYCVFTAFKIWKW